MSRVTEPVLKYLQDNAGRIITTMEVEEATYLERTQVQSALARLTREGVIERRANSMYVFTGSKRNGNPLYEQIAVSKNGDLVLQAENGDVVVARPIQ